jgi:Mg2+ and Co2+ transporter CorA
MNPNDAVKELATLVVEIAQRDTPLHKIKERALKLIDDIDGKVAHVVEEVQAEVKTVEERIFGKKKAEPAPAPVADAPAAADAPTA